MPSLSPSTNTAAVSTTGAGIIKRALRILGVIDATEQLKPEELSQGLEALNSLLDSLNTERLMIYTRTHSSVSTSSATPTLGPGGTLDIVRPEKLDDGDVWLSSGSLDYPIRMMQHGEYAATASMSITAIPSAAYYDAGFPLGTLYFDSTMPSAMTLNVYSWKLHNQISNANAASHPPSGTERLPCIRVGSSSCSGVREDRNARHHRERQQSESELQAHEHEAHRGSLGLPD
jgi:hypothetical protein